MARAHACPAPTVPGRYVAGRASGRSRALNGGVPLILTAVLLFSVYNATTKWLAASYDPLQIVFFRGLFGLLPLLVVVAWTGGGVAALRSRRPGLQVGRALMALGANTCFILSYRAMPLADAVAIGYAAPVFVTALSVPLLSEKVGAHRWSAVLVGFAGVLLIARPGVGVFEPAALLAVFGTLLYALLIIATRRLGDGDSAATTMAHSTSIFTLACGLALPFVWITPDWIDLGLFAAMGCVAGAGMFCFVQAYRLSEASTLAPFDYLAMGWAAVLGFLIWGEVPGAWSIAGITVIAASGLYIAHRESVRTRERARRSAAAPHAGSAAPAPVDRVSRNPSTKPSSASQSVYS